MKSGDVMAHDQNRRPLGADDGMLTRVGKGVWTKRGAAVGAGIGDVGYQVDVFFS